MKHILEHFAKTLDLIILIFAATCQLPTSVEQAQLLEAHPQFCENVQLPTRNVEMMVPLHQHPHMIALRIRM